MSSVCLRGGHQVRGPYSAGADIDTGVTRYRIGLVGDLDHLRPHLLGAGFNPCGGPFGHAATSEIDSLLQRGLKTPVLVSTRQGDPTWSSWLRRLLGSGVRMVVVGDLPAELLDQRCRHVNA